MSIPLKKRQDRTRSILEELGVVRKAVSDEPRTTGGINFIPVTKLKELPGKAYLVQADSDEDAAKHYRRFEPQPDVVYRWRDYYYMPAPELPDFINGFSGEGPKL